MAIPATNKHIPYINTNAGFCVVRNRSDAFGSTVIEPSVQRLIAILKPGGTLYLSWRVIQSNQRDQHGRLYTAFGKRVVSGALTAEYRIDGRRGDQCFVGQSYTLYRGAEVPHYNLTWRGHGQERRPIKSGLNHYTG
jgi:hypothetical protein